ncbi:MAG: hypothetical protein HY983_01990 [Candidatus Magasanikbacteria bacterium]|nr:hypothetical protein [Candidatus Magasanikbacteria bacterium]
MPKIILAFGCVFFGIGVPVAALGSMSSVTYSIYADVIGANGSVYSTGTTYSLNDTPGEAVVGTVTSGSYELRGGFQAAEKDETLSFTVSNSSLDLGTLSRTQVSSASTALTVTSNSLTGYSVSISGASGIMPNGVGDGAVSADSEEYGVAASGADSAVSGDVSVVSGRVLASANTAVIGSETTLTFKASINAASVGGTYSQAVTLTASANF